MLFSSMIRYHRLQLEFVVFMVFMESVEINESVGIVELRMSLEIENCLKVTYLSHVISAIVIVVGPMWMGLSQEVASFPFMVSQVIAEVFAIIGLDVAMFVVQFVTVEVVISAIEATIVVVEAIIGAAVEATIVVEVVINAIEAIIVVAVEATIGVVKATIVVAVEATTTVAVATTIRVTISVVMVIIMAITAMVTHLSIDHRFTCLSPMF